MKKNMIFMCVSGLLFRIIDFVIRADVAVKLGENGMGMYALVLGINGIMAVLATGGFGVAVSNLIPRYIGREPKKVTEIMNTSLYCVGSLSLFVILMTALFGNQIATYYLKESALRFSLYCMAPSLFFVGISSCIKSYFYAHEKIAIPLLSEILELFVKYLCVHFLTEYFRKYGIVFMCTSVFIGFTIGELSSFLLLSIAYRIQKKCIAEQTRYLPILKQIVKICLPVLIGSFTVSFCRTQEDIGILSQLKLFGCTHLAAMENLGVFKGMLMPILVFPLTLVGSVTPILVPKISRLYHLHEGKSLKHTILSLYLYTFCISALFTGIILCFGYQLLEILYHDTNSYLYLRYLSFLLPFIFLDCSSCIILNGMGKQATIMFINISDAILRLAIVYLTIRHLGNTGFIFLTAFSNLYSCLLSTHCVFHALKEKKMQFLPVRT